MSAESATYETNLQSADLMEQAMQEEHKPLSFTQGITVLFGEDIIEDVWENGAELAEKPEAAYEIAAESTADRFEAIGEAAAEAASAAEETPKEIAEEGAEQLRELTDKIEAEIAAGNEMESWKELFRQGDREAIEEAALDALSEEDVTDLPEAEEFAKTVSQEEGQVSRFGHEELESMLAEYQENETQEEEEPSTIENVTASEPLAIGREDFCIKQEEYFRTQYELIIQQAEIFRKRKEYHQSLLDESNAQFDFYTKQADIYLQQIDFYRKQCEN